MAFAHSEDVKCAVDSARHIDESVSTTNKTIGEFEPRIGNVASIPAAVNYTASTDERIKASALRMSVNVRDI
jgi:hypothetical protein